MVLGPAGKQRMESMGLVLNYIVIRLEIRSFIWRGHYNIPSEATWKDNSMSIARRIESCFGTIRQGKDVYIE